MVHHYFTYPVNYFTIHIRIEHARAHCFEDNELNRFFQLWLVAPAVAD